MKITLSEICMTAVNAIFETAADWDIRCDNCTYYVTCKRQMRQDDFCSDFSFRDDDACAGLYGKITKALESEAIKGVVNDRK